jgi:hypothetical protein
MNRKTIIPLNHRKKSRPSKATGEAGPVTRDTVAFSGLSSRYLKD